MGAAPPAKLSRREREVALLVAEGLTSREIAEKLFISERTVEGHVEQIRNKLGFRSRSQVAAWVSAQRLQESVPAPDVPSSVQKRAIPRSPVSSRWLWASGVAMAAIAAGIVLTVLLVPALMAAGPGPRITTFAGTGIAAYSGDEDLATNTDLEHPAGVAVGASGDVYIAEGFRIRHVRSDGHVETVAGNGLQRFQGDGGQATVASLSLAGFGTAEVVGLVVDSQSNLYVADTLNNRVRKVTRDGVISTVAGGGSPNSCLPSTALANVGDHGPGVDAVLCQPHGLAIDGQGNLYIADTANNRIRKLDRNGIISTVAGTGQAGQGRDGQPAGEAQLNAPEGLALDKEGELFIADSGNDIVRKIRADGTIVTVAGDGNAGYSGDRGPGPKAQLNLPLGLAVDDFDNLYIADAANNSIRKVDLSGTITTLAGNGRPAWSGDNSLASAAELSQPVGLAVGKSSELYVADEGNNRIRLIHLTSH